MVLEKKYDIGVIKVQEADMTKIDVFSGFLGAGKTTLIKKLLKEVQSGNLAL